MAYLLVRHKVADYATWKSGYDAHAPARANAGLTELHHLRSIENANEVVLLFSATDVEKARAFAASQDLRETMQRINRIAAGSAPVRQECAARAGNHPSTSHR